MIWPTAATGPKPDGIASAGRPSHGPDQSFAVKRGAYVVWPNTAALAIWAGIFGLCGLSVPSLMGAACGDRFGARLAPASLGFITAFFGIGQGLGPYVGGALEDAFSSLGPSYVLSAAVFALGAVFSLLLGYSRSRGNSRTGSSQPVGPA